MQVKWELCLCHHSELLTKLNRNTLVFVGYPIHFHNSTELVHLRSCHPLETRTGGETSNFRGKQENWGSSRFSSGVISDSDPSTRHAPLLLIRSHYNVSSLSLINDTLPSFKGTKPQTESVNCTVNPLHRCTAKLWYKEWKRGAWGK